MKMYHIIKSLLGPKVRIVHDVPDPRVRTSVIVSQADAPSVVTSLLSGNQI